MKIYDIDGAAFAGLASADVANLAGMQSGNATKRGTPKSPDTHQSQGTAQTAV